MESLTPENIHCMARLLQGAIYGSGIEDGCEYCDYFKECWKDSGGILADDLRTKLQGITGLHLNGLHVQPFSSNFKSWDSLLETTIPEN